MDRAVIKLDVEDANSGNAFFSEETLFTSGTAYMKMQSAYISGKEVLIGLTSTLRLFINGHLFSNECTGFYLHENFLLFVNSTSGLSHELFLYDLNKKLPRSSNNLQLPGEEQSVP